jgi:hypothetical protein
MTFADDDEAVSLANATEYGLACMIAPSGLCSGLPAGAATRVADRPDPVSDEIWDAAARHYTKQQLAALVVATATINAYNRLNAATRQISGEWTAQVAEMAGAADR